MQHPLRLSVYSAVHSVRLATVCRRGMSVVKPTLFLFLGPRLFDRTRTRTQMFYCNFGSPTFQPYVLSTTLLLLLFIHQYLKVYYALLPRFQCGCEKVSHTVRVRVARKR